MLTQQHIDEAVAALGNLWNNANNRNDVFGNALRSLRVRGIRGLANTVEFSWPVVAIAGVNGAGKTTMLQIASTAYTKDQGGRHFRLGEWIRNELRGDTPPVANNADVTFSFWDNTPTLQVPYSVVNSRWTYPRRGNPQRHVSFIGIADFAPRIELKDRVHVNRARLIIRQSEQLSAQMLTSLSAITGKAYGAGRIHEVGAVAGHWHQSIPQLDRGGVTYSEPHMGAGEQKIVGLIRRLEALPRQSLVILEEPELTLHPDAQRGLAWYLMGLARRKGHQILIATHSVDIFETLPPEGRVLLVRTDDRIQVMQNARYLFAAREMAANVRLNKDLILVEDNVAKHLLSEILRRHSRGILGHSEIVAVGNTDDVRRLLASFRASGIRAVGVRDGDIGEGARDALLSLPGDLSPEELLIAPENIQRAERLVDGIQQSYQMAVVAAIGLTGSARAKRIMAALSHQTQLNEEKLADRLTLAWLDANNDEARRLTERITQLFADQEARVVPGAAA